MDCYFLTLQRSAHPNRQGSNDLPEGAQPSGAAAGSETTADGEVIPGHDCFDESRQSFGRMLSIGIHHAKDRGIRVQPAMENGTREAARVSPDQKAYSAVPFAPSRNQFLCPICAAIIYNQQFVRKTKRVEHRLNMRNQPRQVRRFPQSGQDQSQFFFTVNCLYHSETMIWAGYVR